MDKRTFIASSELFSEYSLDISLYMVSSVEDIIKIFKESLVELFQNNKLYILEKKVKETKFHIHGHEIENILTSSPDQIFYICDHC
jgi:hypothetical protein